MIAACISSSFVLPSCRLSRKKYFGPRYSAAISTVVEGYVWTPLAVLGAPSCEGGDALRLVLLLARLALGAQLRRVLQVGLQ